MEQLILIYITYPDKATANKISSQLIEQKLVACSNIFPIQSAYWWQGNIENDDEVVGIVKTRESNYEAVQTFVERHHPYEVPCILKFAFTANAAYAKWILESTISS